MASIFDFARRLYRKGQQSDDPVRRRFYQIAEKARTDPTVSMARRIFEEELGVNGQKFDEMFAAYWLGIERTAELTGKSRDWNVEDEPLMKSVGLTDAAIIAARTDFTTAVLNRVFLRVAIDGREKRRRHEQPSLPKCAEPPPLRTDIPASLNSRSAQDGEPAVAPADRLLEVAEGMMAAMADEAIRKSPKQEALLRLLGGEVPPSAGDGARAGRVGRKPEA
jgi:hypothetical protein